MKMHVTNDWLRNRISNDPDLPVEAGPRGYQDGFITNLSKAGYYSFERKRLVDMESALDDIYTAARRANVEIDIVDNAVDTDGNRQPSLLAVYAKSGSSFDAFKVSQAFTEIVRGRSDETNTR